jgi:hypothetical protein
VYYQALDSLSLLLSHGNSIITGAIAHMDVLIRIKRAVLAGRYAFSEKARVEMETDDLTELDVAESILNAVAIYKRLRSSSPSRNNRREYLYVIQSTNLDGLAIYTKRKLVQEAGIETYYFLVSSKRAL